MDWLKQQQKEVITDRSTSSLRFSFRLIDLQFTVQFTVGLRFHLFIYSLFVEPERHKAAKIVFPVSRTFVLKVHAVLGTISCHFH